MCPVKGQASEATSIPSSLEGCIPGRLLLQGGEERDRENMHGCQPRALLDQQSTQTRASQCQAVHTDGLC